MTTFPSTAPFLADDEYSPQAVERMNAGANVSLTVFQGQKPVIFWIICYFDFYHLILSVDMDHLA